MNAEERGLDGESPQALAYALGHTERELERLAIQARLIDPITRGFFRDAGIVPGMRVLDVGSGAGDVAFVAAEMVGQEGVVIGVDRSSDALAVANERAAARSLRNVSFRVGDPSEMTFERPFDAVIGRFVLQFQSDPAAMLRRLVTHLRPGGLVAFHEGDWSGVRSFPPVPTYDRCCRWIIDTLRLLDTETNMGLKLLSTFVAAGLAAPSMRLEANIGGGDNGADRMHLIADLAVTLLPEMERLGVATSADLGGTLADRMCQEAIGTASTVVHYSLVGAWTRV